MRLDWSALAIRDIREIQDYWLPRDPALLLDLDRDLRTAIIFLMQTPLAGSLVPGSPRRKWRIGRTPYLIFYRVRGDIVRINRIRHERQNWLHSN